MPNTYHIRESNFFNTSLGPDTRNDNLIVGSGKITDMTIPILAGLAAGNGPPGSGPATPMVTSHGRLGDYMGWKVVMKRRPKHDPVQNRTAMNRNNRNVDRWP